jgi:hypothetical protein
VVGRPPVVHGGPIAPPSAPALPRHVERARAAFAQPTKMSPSMAGTITTTFTPSVPSERRCWRCLHMFPAGAPAHARDEFWLCEPCEAVLLPSKRRPS